MAYRAVLERWKSENMLYVCELPGCLISASSVDIAIAAAPNAIRDYLRWAAAHEIPLESKSIELSVVEEGQPILDGIGPIFSSDSHAPDEHEFDTALMICRAALEDLISLYQEADARQQVYKFQPEEWSAREIMEHIARTDLWYATRLRSPYEPSFTFDPPEDVIDAARYSQSHVEDMMREVFYNGRSARFERDYEDWTLRKLIRRRAGHLREHYPQLLLAVRQRIK